MFNIWNQGKYACTKIKLDRNLKNGFNLIGASQGGIIAKYIIEMCENRPPINKLVTLGTPHAGVSMTPYCSYWFCLVLDWVIDRIAYYPIFQRYIAPTNYWRDPQNRASFLSKSSFLAEANNELDVKNLTYRERMVELAGVLLVKNEKDGVVIPRSSAHFGIFDEYYNEIPLQDQDLWKEDWLGL